MPLTRRLAVIATALSVAALLAACTSSPQEKEAGFIKRGRAYLAQKDYARASIAFRNAARAMSSDAEPQYQLGLVSLQTGDFRAAITAFQKATTLNPKHADAQLKLAGLMTTSSHKDILEDA